MIILIAEAKTMTEEQSIKSSDVYREHTPRGEAGAVEIMRNIQQMSAGEVAAAVKVSADLAAKIKRMAYDFPTKTTGIEAIEAYTGVVFKALDYGSLHVTAQQALIGRLRIISSLYGWLRPEDIIKPYRLDFTSKVAPGQRSLYEFWRPDVTAALLDELSRRGDTRILDLMPGDAAKCIDLKTVKKQAVVFKVDFRQALDDGTFRTPTAGLLKTLRGKLLREIALRDITDPDQLRSLETDTFMPLSSQSDSDTIIFCV